MNAIALPAVVSPEEYLEMERAATIKHEFIGGMVYAMAGGTPDHATISYNLNAEVRMQLKGKPCKGNHEGQRVRVEATDDAVYPDGIIRCPPFKFHPNDTDAITNPSVVFEVLSPSTQNRDREYKFDLYTSIPECTDYVLIHFRRVRVEHFSRTGNEPWTVNVLHWRRDVLKLERYGVAVSLGDIYDGVELAEGMILVGDAGGESS